MTIIVNAKNSLISQFNFTSTATSITNVDNANVSVIPQYTYGTGNFQIDAAIYITGILASGGSRLFNLTSLTKDQLDYSSTLSFSGIKSISVMNASTGVGFNANILATGVSPLTAMFNGSGNITLKPYGAFVCNDPYGSIRMVNGNQFRLADAGSGVNYKIVVLGTLS